MIKAHFENVENCYDAERSWIARDDGSNGVEVIMIEYCGDMESVICWRRVDDDFGAWHLGTIADLLESASKEDCSGND